MTFGGGVATNGDAVVRGEGIEAVSVPDAGAFLARLLRLDPAAVVRLRPVGALPAAAELWARLPFGVLVVRGIRAGLDADATVRARDLLALLEGGRRGEGHPRGLPPRRDTEWRWSLPPAAGDEVERLPAGALRRVAAAAAATVRAGRQRPGAGLRDALLDHVPITVITDGGPPVPVSQRLVQAVLRMGFLGEGDDTPVGVRVVGRWTGLAARYGVAWHRRDPI